MFNKFDEILTNLCMYIYIYVVQGRYLVHSLSYAIGSPSRGSREALEVSLSLFPISLYTFIYKEEDVIGGPMGPHGASRLSSL